MLKFSSKFSNNLINLEKQYGFDYFSAALLYTIDILFLPSVVPIPSVAVGFISPFARAASNFDINIGSLYIIADFRVYTFDCII